MGLSKSKIAQLFLEFSCFVAFVQTLFSKILLYYFAGLLDSNCTGVEPFTSSFKEGFGSQIAIYKKLLGFFLCNKFFFVRHLNYQSEIKIVGVSLLKIIHSFFGIVSTAYFYVRVGLRGLINFDHVYIRKLLDELLEHFFLSAVFILYWSFCDIGTYQLIQTTTKNNPFYSNTLQMVYCK